MAGLRVMAAYRDRPRYGPYFLAATLIYVLAGLGFVGIVLWRLWTEVLNAWPT